ncbi:MAG TPA: TAXI family TRAP transporter solute-binding subunit [Polyangiaceae bacterium]|nr:TAXI family TRAP transporter solute-binding subunit [Polyangiaceae bacterium]
MKRPVLASACEHGCPWGELGDFVAEAMQPLGYDVVQCRNCNLDQGPKLVSTASYPPPLGVQDTFVGTTTRIDARVDFGITSSDLLAWGYAGNNGYAQYGAFPNLRLIAKIEDPTYLLVAVKADSDITDLADVAKDKRAVTILGGGSPISQPVLDYYGLTMDAVTAWGGAYHDAIVYGQADDPDFDIVINELASPANNPESAYWTKISQKHDLRFLDLPEPVLAQLASDATLGVTRATVKWGFLKGVDRPIATVAESGHAVFARDDAPESAAYDIAKAIDVHRDALKWFIRPYSYDSRTVWADQNVPLHPGAARYYREAGYLRPNACENADAAAASSAVSKSSSSCAVTGPTRTTSAASVSFVLLLLSASARRVRRRPRSPHP